MSDLRAWRPHGPGRRVVVVAGVVVVIVGVVLAVADPFAGGAGPSGNLDNETATSLVTVARRSLESQTQVDGTLGYAGASTVIMPTGTTRSDLAKDRQAYASASATLHAARGTLATDRAALEHAQSQLAADRLKQSVDCRGADAAAASSTSASASAAETPCSSAVQDSATAEEAVTSAEAKVTTDAGQVATAQVSVTAAQQTLDVAEGSAVVYDAGSTYTSLPAVGKVIRRGQALYAIAGSPVLLLYGSVTPWRAFRAGMSPGRDVAELNANLRALGYGPGLAGDAFTGATHAAILALQAAHGLERTGALLLGSVVFKSSAVRVTSVSATRGGAVQAGPVLAFTATRRQVKVDLDASQQASVKVGDKVTITLPDQETTPGVVSSVGAVATPGSGENTTPTVEVHITPTHPAATGRLDSAPVQVSITTDSVSNVLVVPVNALLALAGGGYAVEAVDRAGVHRLLPVTTGLFDDEDGLVEVSGPSLRAGLRVVVPSS